jgi:hypothetical protein
MCTRARDDTGLGGYMWIRFDSRGVGFSEEQRAGMPRNVNGRRRFLIPIQALSIFCFVSVRRGRPSPPLNPS